MNVSCLKVSYPILYLYCQWKTLMLTYTIDRKSTHICNIFQFECKVLNKGTTGTIFITSLVWLGIEPWTSRTRSQHNTTRLSRRRFICNDLWHKQNNDARAWKITKNLLVLLIVGMVEKCIAGFKIITKITASLIASVVECLLRVREVQGSIPIQGHRHTKEFIKMVPVVHFFSTQHWKGKYWLFLKK